MIRLDPIPVPVDNILDSLPKDKKKEILEAFFNDSVSEQNPLIEKIIRKKPKKDLEKVLEEQGIKIIK